MITIKLQGGLGNQMFQYAFGRMVSSQMRTPLLLDTSWYLKSSERVYELSQFNIQARIATEQELEAAHSPFQKIWDLFRSHKHFITEKSTRFDPKAFDARENSYLDGYWQSENYFAPIADKILSELAPKQPLGGFAGDPARVIGNSECPISIHIRRGDYVTNPKFAAIHGTLPLSYYEEAMALVEQTVENPRYFLFSDDPAWAKNHLDSKFKIDVVSDPRMSTVEELYLMALCRHHIIANSSFSWWGAWFDRSSDKIVIAPKNWFVDLKKNSSEIVPPQWIKI